MSRLTFDQFPEQERADFEACCREHGFAPEDFVVLSAEHISESLCEGLEVVTVKRDTGFQQYAPPGWIAEFHDSLQHGEFGAPPLRH